MHNQTLYPWLTPYWKKLQLALERESLPDALLFSALEGLGETQLIHKLCQALLCANDTVSACGFCHACDLMQANTHPDLHRIRPLDDKKSISVDQIRECNRFALESSQLNGMRVIVIEAAHIMTESAMNALLKTLETPPTGCVFILATPVPHRLLPTIRSRCQQWHIQTPGASQYQVWLAEQDLTGIEPLYQHLCFGAPLKMKAFVEQDKNKQFDNIIRALSDFIADDFALPKSFVDAVAEDTLYWLPLVNLSLVELQKSYFTPCVTVDSHPGLSAMKDQMSYQQVYALTHSLMALIEQLTVHPGLNKDLLLSQWLIQAKT